jgi:hypothetical protein
MNILRVFPRKTSFTPTDPMAFVGDPGLFLPPADEVHISVTFTWDMAEGKRLQSAWAQHYPIVKIGGPAFGYSLAGFTPGLYVKQGVTFTTRGCNNRCPWCLVPKMEGRLMEITDFSDGWIIQDNNLLQASREHIQRVFEMLRRQKHPITFSGGIQASLIKDWFVNELRTIKLDSLFLAADTPGAIRPLERAIKKLAGFGRRQIQVYCMIGKDEKIQDACARLQSIWNLGAMPFAQLYQPPDKYIQYSLEWKKLAWEWSRPTVMLSQLKPPETKSDPQLPLL